LLPAGGAGLRDRLTTLASRSGGRRFDHVATGKHRHMLWILLLILLIAIFGIGTVLEAAFWVLLIMAVFVVLAFLGLARLMR
jgi:hypothetical protein